MQAENKYDNYIYISKWVKEKSGTRRKTALTCTNKLAFYPESLEFYENSMKKGCESKETFKKH